MISRFAFLALVLSSAALLPKSAWSAEPAHAGWTPELILQVKVLTEPTASPDGGQLAYVVAAPSMEEEKSEWLSQVYLSRADGTGAQQLTRGANSCDHPNS